MKNITTFKASAGWDRLDSRWLNAGNENRAVKFYTDIGGIGDSSFVYCRVACRGGCMVAVNGRTAFNPILDENDGRLTIHSHELSGMFGSDEDNRVELVTAGGASVRAVFFFGDADGRVARLSTDESWSAVSDGRHFSDGNERLDARAIGSEIFTPTYTDAQISDCGDDEAREPDMFVNPVKVFADDSRLRRVYDFGEEIFGAPIITASCVRGAKIKAVCADLSVKGKSLAVPTDISPQMFRKNAKILVCSGFGADRLYPMTGASRFRYVYACGESADYTITALACANFSR